MNLSIFFTPAGILTLAALLIFFILGSRTYRLRALSLPCMSALTSLFYFYLLPEFALLNGEYEFFGLSLTDLEAAHSLAFLYTTGIAVACYVFSRTLRIDPLTGEREEREPNMYIFWLLCCVALIGLVFLAMTDQLIIFNPNAETNFQSERNFLNQTYNLMLPLAIFWLVRSHFNKSSALVLLFVTALYVYAGFRFRILILALSAFSAFAITHRIRIRLSYVLIASIAGILVFNVIGNVRQYGKGLDFSNLEGAEIAEVSKSAGGEIGPVYTVQTIAEGELPELILAEPWVVGIGMLVPRAWWADKPKATYLEYYIRDMNQAGAADAGIAGLQHIEMLLQFGWIGVPFLAFTYFAIAIALVKAVLSLGIVGRIAGYAIIPGLFGYYMQSRGYFAQIFTDSIFLLGPIFLIYSVRPRAKPRVIKRL